MNRCFENLWKSRGGHHSKSLCLSDMTAVINNIDNQLDATITIY